MAPYAHGKDGLNFSEEPKNSLSTSPSFVLRTMGISRKSVAKSKKGCRTCKIRHVKCDEGKPQYQRCISTGRKCDGYLYSGEVIPQSDSVIDIMGKIARDLRCASTSDGLQEHRSFEFFRLETIPGIGGFFAIATWKLVLQACNQEPIVRQAAIALGALHEKMSLQANCNGDSSNIETEFPVVQHGKAMATVRKYLEREISPKLDGVLMCALIFISIEVMQHNYVGASVHLENSLPLLLPKSKDHAPGVDSDMSVAFRILDLHASKGCLSWSNHSQKINVWGQQKSSPSGSYSLDVLFELEALQINLAQSNLKVTPILVPRNAKSSSSSSERFSNPQSVF